MSRLWKLRLSEGWCWDFDLGFSFTAEIGSPEEFREQMQICISSVCDRNWSGNETQSNLDYTCTHPCMPLWTTHTSKNADTDLYLQMLAYFCDNSGGNNADSCNFSMGTVFWTAPTDSRNSHFLSHRLVCVSLDILSSSLPINCYCAKKCSEWWGVGSRRGPFLSPGGVGSLVCLAREGTNPRDGFQLGLVSPGQTRPRRRWTKQAVAHSRWPIISQLEGCPKKVSHSSSSHVFPYCFTKA